MSKLSFIFALILPYWPVLSTLLLYEKTFLEQVVYSSIYIYVCVCVCMCVCERERERERQRERV